jgi:hypothetical protein
VIGDIEAQLGQWRVWKRLGSVAMHMIAQRVRQAVEEASRVRLRALIFTQFRENEMVSAAGEGHRVGGVWCRSKARLGRSSNFAAAVQHVRVVTIPEFAD